MKPVAALAWDRIVPTRMVSLVEAQQMTAVTSESSKMDKGQELEMRFAK